ncbi:hypothetical protein ACHQM5_030450 [Ranunculus cassubicifolius]
MQIQSSPSSFQAALSFVSDDRKQNLLCDWISREEILKKYLKRAELSTEIFSESMLTKDAKDATAGSSCLDHSSACYKISNISNMCASSEINHVYKRRKMQSNSVSLPSHLETDKTKGDVDSLSAIGSKGDSFGQLIHKSDSCGGSIVSTNICNSDVICDGSTSTFNQVNRHDGDLCTSIGKKGDMEVVRKLESFNGCSGGRDEPFNEAVDGKSSFEYCKGNDSFSSSKSNLEHGPASTKIDIDDTGECSSSDISEKELCISILKSHGLLGRGSSIGTSGSTDGVATNDERIGSFLCKVCGQMENSLSMLICDDCEDAFHVSCCNPKIKKIPAYEWYCYPCLRKKHKFPVESANKRSSKINCRNRVSKSVSSLIKCMVKDTEPYTTDVRVGKGFQADIPEWCGLISEDYDSFGEPLQMDPTEAGQLDKWTTSKSSKPTVGNWLQCREVQDDGTICGKWRRAPLFEVQTENWDCSCSLLWDLFHADCAVPQELETDQVLVHLKYIRLLRPRLGAANNIRK